ncbi:MAG: hypothetical protein AB7N80_05130 [Bdellovibrionales bacterium]
MTSVQLLSNTAKSSAPFTTGHGFRPGDIPTGYQVVTNSAGIIQFQSLVKNRWPDGSVKFAILSGLANLAAGSPLKVDLFAGTPGVQAAPLAESKLQELAPQASIVYEGQSVLLADLIGKISSFDTAKNHFSAGISQQWISGPVMSSWIYSSGIGTDAHLRAWFEVRLYANNQIEILPWVENGYLMKSGATTKAGVYQFAMGGTSRFSANITLAHHTRTPLVSGSTKSHWTGTDPGIELKIDTVYLQNSSLVPTYRSEVGVSNATLEGYTKSYTPNAVHDHSPDMGSPGFDQSIGLLPAWDAAYLMSKGDKRALNSVLINAFANGRYGLYYRDEKTNRPLKFSNYPNLVIQETNSGIKSVGTSSIGQFTPSTSGTSPAGYANSHHHSMGYLAYLITGQFFFIEQTQFLATINYLKNSDTIRGLSKGILITNTGANLPRGAAWSIRSLAQAASMTADDDPYRAELLSSVRENAIYYHTKYVAQANCPQGFAEPYEDYVSGDGIWTLPIWMDDFFTAAFGYMIDIQVVPSDSKAKALEFFNWKAKAIIGRLGPSGQAGSFDFRYAAQYTLPGALKDASNGTSPWSQNGPWYADWGALFRATVAAPTAFDNRLTGGYFPDPNGYWGNLMPAISYAVTLKTPGAAEAFARLTGAANWSEFPALCPNSPVWCLKPR